MFSGKTEELIERLRVVRNLGRNVKVLKPSIDTRYSVSEIVSHSGFRLPADPIGDQIEVPVGTEVVGIDEGQFLSASAVPQIVRLVGQGVRVIVAGLDLTSWGEPFGPIPSLMAFADQVVKLRGSCAQCGRESTRTQRLAPVDRSKEALLSPIYVGGAESYEARCFACFKP